MDNDILRHFDMFVATIWIAERGVYIWFIAEMHFKYFAWRRCSNYIFIIDLTPGFIGLGKDDSKAMRETFNFGDLMRLILEILR